MVVFFYWQVNTMKPMKPCNFTACTVLIPFDERYCAKHIHAKRETHQVYDAMRREREPHIRNLYNSDRWRKLSRQIKLRDDFLCQKCIKEGVYSNADITDHIIEIKDDWDKRWDTGNMISLCHFHHNKKTNEEKKKREKSFKTF